MSLEVLEKIGDALDSLDRRSESMRQEQQRQGKLLAELAKALLRSSLPPPPLAEADTERPP